MKRALFLDRDGVINASITINGKPFPPKNIDELVILPKVAESLKLLHEQNFILIVITNQPDVARNTISKETVEDINKYLMAKLCLDKIYTCFHDDSDNCECRKPKIGSFLRAAKSYNIDLSASYMIGDRWKDIEAGKKAGCKTFFIDYGYNEKKPFDYDYSVKSLYNASQIILGV